MKVLALKLITGEDVLGELESQSETEFVICNPVGISIVRGKDGQPNVGFSPFPLHSEQKPGTTLALAKKNVVYSYTPAEDFVSNYNQIFGSGIVLPPTKSLITG
jgi:hypothetical protein